MATLTECEQAAAWLAEAKAALHKLLTGTKVVSLAHADKQLRYTEADIGALRAYVRDLQAQVDVCNGTARRGRILYFEPCGW